MLFQRHVVGELVEAEEAQGGVGAAELAPHGGAEQSIGQADDPKDDGQVYALYECQQS